MDSLFQPPYECHLCGELFESMTARTMHVERERCPQVNSEEDKYKADAGNIVSDLKG